MAIATLNKITKNYLNENGSAPALQEISLQVEPGDFLCVAGPSGAGKTTLLNIIGGLDDANSGQIVVHKVAIFELAKNDLVEFRNRNLGFIFETFNLIPSLTVFENVELPLILIKMKNKEERAANVTGILKDVGLENFVNRRPEELNNEQQQRVALARALVKNPIIVLADEPTGRLDSKAAEGLIQLMRQINESYQTTFIYSTHDPTLVSYAKRIIELQDGRISSDEMNSNLNYS